MMGSIPPKDDMPPELHVRPDFVPPHIWPGIREYVLMGREQGGFLAALFAGDLFIAATHADRQNREALGELGRWIAHMLPPNCHGSYKKTEAWRKAGGLRGIYKPLERVDVHEIKPGSERDDKGDE